MKVTTATAGLPLLNHPQSSVTINLNIYSFQSHLHTFTTDPIVYLSSQNPLLYAYLPRPITPFWRLRRDSNFGGFRTQNSFSFGFGDSDDEDDGDDFGRKRRGSRRRRRRREWWSDDSSEEMDEGSGIVEELIDSIWIFKVFGSYGWILPFILISMLLATGPKAFFTALAIPIGQSVLTLAFKKLLRKMQKNPKQKTKNKKKLRVSAPSNWDGGEEEEESQRNQIRSMGYQSWVEIYGVRVNKDSQYDSLPFGGWEELDRPNRSAQTSRPGRTIREDKTKFSRREKKGDVPLLLRLLIAVFPFLGSWTKML